MHTPFINILRFCVRSLSYPIFRKLNNLTYDKKVIIRNVFGEETFNHICGSYYNFRNFIQLNALDLYQLTILLKCCRFSYITYSSKIPISETLLNVFIEDSTIYNITTLNRHARYLLKIIQLYFYKDINVSFLQFLNSFNSYYKMKFIRLGDNCISVSYITHKIKQTFIQNPAAFVKKVSIF